MDLPSLETAAPLRNLNFEPPLYYSFLLTCCSILIATYLCLHEDSNQLTGRLFPIPGVLRPSLSPCPWKFTNTPNSLTSLSLSFPFLVWQSPNLANTKHPLFHDKHLSSWINWPNNTYIWADHFHVMITSPRWTLNPAWQSYYVSSRSVLFSSLLPSNCPPPFSTQMPFRDESWTSSKT